MQAMQAVLCCASIVFWLCHTLEWDSYPSLWQCALSFFALRTASVCWAVQIKDLLMATYFAADHVVWAFQIGLIQDKKVGERAQKTSLWGWALGSVLTMIIEANNILSVSYLQQTGVVLITFSHEAISWLRTCRSWMHGLHGGGRCSFLGCQQLLLTVSQTSVPLAAQ